MGTSKVRTVVGLLGAFTMMSCDYSADEPASQTVEGALSVQGYSLWQPAVPSINFTGIAFCYPGAFATDAQYATFRSATFDAARDWEIATDGRLKLTPIGKCGRGIEVRMDTMDSNGRTKIGQDSEPIHVNRNHINDYDTIKDVALHELGHKLGFTHEQVHPDSTCAERQTTKFLFWEFETDTVGLSFFPYDPDSTMNYCQPRGIGLSAGDVDAVQRFYGGNEYLLSDGRTYWLRSGHGDFLGNGFRPEMSSRHTFTNVGRTGQDIHYGHKVTIRSDKGTYLYASTSTNPKSGVVTVNVGYTSTPFVWDVGGFRTSGAVGVNDPLAFSVPNGSNKRLFLGASKNFKNGMVTLAAGLLSTTSTTPPQEAGHVWRVLGPGPETRSVCDSGSTRCGNTCCGNGNSCKDASISLCCGMFNERCGNVCCDLNSTCVAGVCRVPTPPPPPPPSACSGRPTCRTIADCPSAFNFCGSGCCGQIR